MIKALSVYSDTSGCDYHRLVLPFQFGSQYVDNSAFESLNGDTPALFREAELVVFNREMKLPEWDISDIKKLGAKVVLDLDDYWELGPMHYLYNHYKANKTPEKIIRNIRMADAVTVATARLADRVRQFNKKVFVIPNALPFGHGQFSVGKKEKQDAFNLLYTGQVSHLNDLGLISDAMKQISFDDNPLMNGMLAGYDDGNPICRQMESVFTSNGYLKNYQRIPHMELGKYMSIYDNADVALVPLLNNSFNRHKSNLKLLEAGAKKLPVICSKVAPYYDNPETPVMWAESKADWYQHIQYLAQNRNYAHELGERLHEWTTAKYNLFDWNKVRFELYSDIVNS